jgi:uncharacterized membrane protein YhaH (DUF805 family)
MRKYYYSIGGTRLGPVTLGELKLVNGLTPETLVWYEGLSSWVRAGDIAELSELFASVSPVSSERSMFTDSFSFEGRIRRLEYGLSLIISSCVGAFNLFILGSSDAFIVIVLYWIILIANWEFLLAQGSKRSHDIGNSGWWQLIPFYSLYILFAEGDRGENEYGPNPKGE